MMLYDGLCPTKSRICQNTINFRATDPEPETHLIPDPLYSLCDFEFLIDGHVFAIFAKEITEKQKEQEGCRSCEQCGEDETGVVPCEIIENEQTPVFVKRSCKFEASEEVSCDFEDDVRAEVEDEEAEDPVTGDEPCFQG